MLRGDFFIWRLLTFIWRMRPVEKAYDDEPPALNRPVTSLKGRMDVGNDYKRIEQN